MLARLNRPVPVAVLLFALVEALFCWRLTIPGKLVFDEVWYVPAARALRTLSGPTNTEHPLLAKLFIAGGIGLFGDTPLGWRFFSTIAASVVVVGVFAIGWLATGRMRAAVLAALFAALNFTVFVQARIAMLDGYMAAFVVAAVAMMMWSARAKGDAVRWRWIAGAALLGLATACKWTAAPYVGYAAIAFLILRRRHPGRWPGLNPVEAILSLGLVSIGVYFATFAPAFFYHADAMTWRGLVPFQREMLNRQTLVLPPHTYQSAWWSWPFDIRPIWYFYEVSDGAQRGILMIGNPAILWGGLVALVYCVWRWIARRDVLAGSVAGLWVGSYAMWAVIPKSLGFFYYYYLSNIWLALVLAIAWDRAGRGRLRYWDEMYAVAVAVLFIHFYPILSAARLSGPQAFNHWMWFASWR